MTHARKMPALGAATLVALGLAAVQPAHAQIAGFGTGSNFTLNHTGNGPAATINTGVLQLTQAVNDSDNSAWYNTLQNTQGFVAKFTYTPAATATADGVAFALQTNGLNALGAGGGSLGYGGTNGTAGYAALTNSAGFALNLYNSGNDAHTGVAIPNGTIAIAYGAGGAIPSYLNTGLLVGGGAVNVTLTSNGSQVLASLVQGANTFNYTYSADVPLALGAATAYAGFTGATGGLNADQQISNFTFTPTAAPAAAYVNITSPTDTIITVDGTGAVPAGGDTSGDGGVSHVIDRNSGTKYLNFTGTGSGFIITPNKGTTVVTALELTSANDTPGRDPATFTFLGKNAGDATFTQIAAGNVPVFADRFQSQILTFANTKAYTSYELLFPTLVGAYPTAVNSMQIAEVGLLAAAPEPGEVAAMLLGGLGLLGLIARKRRVSA